MADQADYRASTATLVRIPYVWQLTHSVDFLYVFTDFTIWSTVENGVGIIASSIATLRPLFRKAIDLTRGTSTVPTHLPRYSTTVRRDSVRDTAFHCRGLSQEYDVEKAQKPKKKVSMSEGVHAHVEKPISALVRDGKGKGKDTSPQRATFDHQSSNSGWSWNSRNPRNSRNQGVEEWVEDWGNSARSSRSRLMSARSSRRTTW
jgi:hypothetical protein